MSHGRRTKALERGKPRRAPSSRTVNSRPMEQRTSRGSKTLKSGPRSFAFARKRSNEGNDKRGQAPERVYGSLEWEGPEGVSLGVPAR